MITVPAWKFKELDEAGHIVWVDGYPYLKSPAVYGIVGPLMPKEKENEAAVDDEIRDR